MSNEKMKKEDSAQVWKRWAADRNIELDLEQSNIVADNYQSVMSSLMTTVEGFSKMKPEDQNKIFADQIMRMLSGIESAREEVDRAVPGFYGRMPGGR